MPVLYATTAATCIVIALLMRNGCILWTATALALDWVLCAAVGFSDGSGTNWAVNSTVDFIAASLMLCVPISRPQLAVVSFFVPMMLCHAALGICGHSYVHDRMYLIGLEWLSWMQIASLGLWIGHVAFESLGRYRNPDRRSQAYYAHLEAIRSGRNKK